MGDFPQVSVQIVAVVVGLTQAAKRLGVQDKATLIFSVAIGFLLGIGHQISINGTPDEFNAWFGVLLAGIIHGLAPSGLYEATQGVLRKALVAAQNGEAG